MNDTEMKMRLKLLGALAVAGTAALLAWIMKAPLLESILVGLAIALGVVFLVKLGQVMRATIAPGTGSLAIGGAQGPGRSWRRIAVGMGVLVLLALVGPQWAIARSDPYRLALEAARGSAACVEALGSPIEGRGLIKYHYAFGEPATADLTIPVAGPKGGGSLRLKAARAGGAWVLTELRLERPATQVPIVLPTR